VPEEYILGLEKEAFLELLKNEKTMERINAMLETGKPLRN
jgi:3-hydroxyacyl-CoA dehydrogenase